jgi:hypothetical protein
VTQHLTEHKLFEQATKTQALVDAHGLQPALARRWERIDQDLFRACLHAERLTRSQDRPAWSPKPHQASMTVAQWKIALKHKDKSGLCRSTRTTRATNQLG